MKKPDVIKQVAQYSGLTQTDANLAVKAFISCVTPKPTKL